MGEKQLYGYYKRQTSEKTLIEQRETAYLLTATQNNDIRTNYIKTIIGKM